ncbi:MAG: hypothetical protein HKN32_08885 [Flavobacteriales bacterium]|nr:hypothetical protein [Flavobacteriales bacterium]
MVFRRNNPPGLLAASGIWNTVFFLFVVVLLASGCASEESDLPEITPTEAKPPPFDSELWKAEIDGAFPHRPAMLENVLYNEELRALQVEELKTQLGSPQKEVDGYLYYTIDATRIGSWTLHAKTLVIKTDSLGAVEWMKIHE